MIDDVTRRDFLGYSALAAAALGGTGGMAPTAVGATQTGGKLPPPETLKRLAEEYYRVIDKEGPGAGKGYHTTPSAYHGANHTGFENLTPKQMGEAFYTAFPDFTHVIMDQVAQGDIVMERIRYFATHSGEFMGIPATGRKITYTGMDWVRFEQGRSVERWGVANEFELRRQLLGLPDPRPDETKAILASDRAVILERFGPTAAKNFDRL
jgi:predicted ester cyclase